MDDGVPEPAEAEGAGLTSTFKVAPKPVAGVEAAVVAEPVCNAA
jgi:hypothetical protein